MRHGKVGLQLGADQVYYISRCEEKKTIQLTITMPVRDDVKSGKKRRELHHEVTGRHHEGVHASSEEEACLPRTLSKLFYPPYHS